MKILTPLIVVLVILGAAVYFIPLPHYHYHAPAGVYYMRETHKFTTPLTFTWTAGEKLRVVPDVASSPGTHMLTNGMFTAEVDDQLLTTDVDLANALQRVNAESPAGKKVVASH